MPFLWSVLRLIALPSKLELSKSMVKHCIYVVHIEKCDEVYLKCNKMFKMSSILVYVNEMLATTVYVYVTFTIINWLSHVIVIHY